MHFLVDASLPGPTGDVIRHAGHDATDVRDIGLGSADDSIIAALAQTNQYCLISRDGDFGNVLDYPPEDYFGLVVIDAPEGAGRDVVLTMVAQFLAATDVLLRLKGRL